MSRRFSTEFVQWPPKKSLSESISEDAKEILEPISSFRVALPQVLASTAKNLLLLDLGMTITFSTIILPVLLDGKDPLGIHFTKDEASWFSSVLFICQPLGSILSGIALEPVGRKFSMILVNFPLIIGWLLFYFCETKAVIFVATAIMGLGVGFMEAPIITYVGEISQPHLRGTLTSYSNLFATFGMVLVYLFGSLVEWRTVAIIAIAVPLVTIVAISQVPETPIWLMARGRVEEAERSLRWLRGWVSSKYVKKEFEQLTRYSDATRLRKRTNGIVNPSFLADDGSTVQEYRNFQQLSFGEKVKDITRPGMLKPLGFIVAYFFFGNFTGITATRPYMIILVKDLKMPLDPSWTTVVFGSLSFIGSVSCMITIAKFKKRPIAILSMFGCTISSFGIYFYEDPWAAFGFYLILTFCTSYGAYGLIWTLLSEVFPFRGRGAAAGTAAAISYGITFCAVKSYQPLQDLLGVRGIFAFYGTMSLLGTVFLYFFMLETEGRELEDIENDYDKKPARPNTKPPQDSSSYI